MTALQDARTAQELPGSQFPLGATPGDGGTNFAVASSVADAVTLCLFDDAGTETQIPLPDYDAGVWHGFVPGVGPGQAVRVPGNRSLRSRPGPALQPGEAAARPLCPGGQRRGHVRAGGVRLRGGQPGRAEHARLRRAHAAQPRRGRHVRLDRWRPAQAPVLRHDHLRGARQGVHDAPPQGAGRTARHVRRVRARGRRRLPDRPRRDRRRAAARAPERAGKLPAAARADELLGLQHHRLLRAAQRVFRGGAGRRPAARSPSSRPWWTPCTRRASR